jgi:predicted metal-dependent RNase
MTSILEQVKAELPRGSEIKETVYEGPDIIFYTMSKEFFRGSGAIIRGLVDKVKKRIEVRAHHSILMPEDKAEALIKESIAKEAGLRDIYFEPEFGKVVIHAEKPGLVIGKAGETLRNIKETSFWTPVVARAPAIDSEIIAGIRRMLHKEVGYRKKFLNSLGEKIYATDTKPVEWARLLGLGACREVGRSCFLLMTPQSRIMLDCGVSFSASRQFPILDVPEVDLAKLDGIVLSHPHMDHAGLLPMLYEYGYRGPLWCTRPTRDQAALMCLDYIKVAQREGGKAPYTSKGIEEMIKHAVTLEWGQVTDIAPDMRLTLENSGHILGGSLSHFNIGDGMTNFIYSLDWTVPVVLINPQGELVSEPIGKVVDNAVKYAEVTTDGFVERAANSEGWKAMAFNPKTLKAEIVPVSSFMRHPITEKLYRIRAAGGKETVVTASHNVFQVADGEVRSVKTKDLRPGDFILGAKHLPIEEKEALVDLMPYEDELRIRHSEDEIRSKVMELQDRAKALYPEEHEEVLAYVADHLVGRVLNEIAKKHGRKTVTVRSRLSAMGIKPNPNRGHTIASKLRITSPLARFLGYYVSEGSSRNNVVRITNYDGSVLQDCISIMRTELGIDGKVYKDDVSAVFCSKQLEFILKKVLGCGNSAYTKRVPRMLMRAPAEVVWEFLRGYYVGDGNFRVRSSGCCISANSKSPELIRDIAMLLARFGIVPSLEFNRTSGMYMAHVNASDKIEQMLNWLNIPEWTAKFSAKMRHKTRAGANERIPFSALSMAAQVSVQKTSYQTATSAGLLQLQKISQIQEIDSKLMESCFAFAKILSIEEVEPTGPYVYDLCIEGYENFLTGQGFLFVHNTGDMKYERTKLFDAAYTGFSRAEAVLIESTYGDETIPPHRDGEAELVAIAKRVTERGGKLIIPAFAMERAQDVILILVDSGITAPIYLDGMIWDVTAIHTAYPEFMSKDMQTRILRRQQNPFTDPRLRGIGSGQERKALLHSPEPAIVLTTSGMLQGGPVLDYIKEWAPDERNALMFVGYQAEGTLGRRIQKGWRYVSMEGDDKGLELKLEICTVRGLSAHSDYRQMISWLRDMRGKPRKVICNHGETNTISAFMRTLHRELKVETAAPRLLETIRLR